MNNTNHMDWPFLTLDKDLWLFVVNVKMNLKITRNLLIV